MKLAPTRSRMMRNALLSTFFTLVGSSTVIGQSIPFVDFRPAEANLPGSYLQVAPTTVSAPAIRWNFSEATPLISGSVPIFGGVSITNSGDGVNGSDLRLHDNSPNVWPNIASVFVYASTTGTSVNNVDMMFLWKRYDFLGLGSGQAARFDSASSLSVTTSSWSQAVGGQSAEIRFVIKDSGQYYVSEAVLASPTGGTLTLGDFSAIPQIGKRWARFFPSASNFAIPASPEFLAVNFQNVEAVCWIGRGSRGWSSVFGFSSFAASGSPATFSAAQSQNLATIEDFNVAQPFADVFKTSRVWQTQNAVPIAGSQNPWHTRLTEFVPTDIHGWPTQVPFNQPYGENAIHPDYADPTQPGYNPNFRLSLGQYAHTTTTVVIPGVYRLRFQGSGTFELTYRPGAYNVIERFDPARISTLPIDAEGRRYFDTQPIVLVPQESDVQLSAILLKIIQSSGTNYLRNFECISPGYANTNLRKAPFHQAFKQTLGLYTTLRYMVWGMTNNNPTVTWADRTTPKSYTQARRQGCTLEYMVKLSNETGKNLWISIPHLATDDYVRKAAQLLRFGAKADGMPFDPNVDPVSAREWPGLNSGLKAYIEYSNETWNISPGFEQSGYCVEQGKLLRASHSAFSPFDYEVGHQYTAYRAAQIWQIFDEVWQSEARDRLVRVMASQMAEGVSRTRMEAFLIPGLVTNGQYPDVLSVAPYMGYPIGNDLIATNTLGTTTPEQIVQMTRSHMEEDVLPSLRIQAEIARQYGVPLSTYESGQHLIGTGANLFRQDLAAKLNDANRHPTMETLYRDYLQMLSDEGVVENGNFVDFGRHSNYGSWGMREWLNQPDSLAPKWRAFVAHANAHPASNLAPVFIGDGQDSVVDADGDGFAVVPLNATNSVDYDGRVVAAEWMVGTWTGTGLNTTRNHPVGKHIVSVRITDDDGAVTTDSYEVTVRPQGADAGLVTSHFLSGNPTVYPGVQKPWTATSLKAPGLVFGGWTWTPRQGDAPGVVNGAAFSDSFAVNLSAGNQTRSTFADALAGNQYLSSTVSPQPGKTLDLRGAEIEWKIVSTSSFSARRFVLMSSVRGFGEPNAIFVSPQISTGDAVNPRTTVFSTVFPVEEAYRNLTGPVELRIYLYDNIYGGQPIQLSAFRLTGTQR